MGMPFFVSLPKPYMCLLQKVGVVDDLVVVQEHDRVEPEHVGQHQAEVAHRAVPRQADLLLQLAQAQLLHALLDERKLRRSTTSAFSVE